MPKDLTDDTSTSVQVMAWCHQAARYYLNQSLPKDQHEKSFNFHDAMS